MKQEEIYRVIREAKRMIVEDGINKQNLTVIETMGYLFRAAYRQAISKDIDELYEYWPELVF